MAVTPQTNTTLEAIAEALLRCQSIAICGHKNPDGDCLGSQVALKYALEALGKRVDLLLVEPESIPTNLRFLPGSSEFVAAASYDDFVDCFVAVDVPTPERLGDADRIRKQVELTITIDHHAVPEAMSQLSFTDPDAASTTMLIWELIALLGINPPLESAIAAYTGLMTDTGRFQFQNTDERAFLAAASMVSAGANPGYISAEVYHNRSRASLALQTAAIDHMTLLGQDTIALSWISQEDLAAAQGTSKDAETLIDLLRSLQGVRIACLLKEQPEGVRGSLRAKDDTDVAAIAKQFGGGGHKAAAGFTYEGSLEQAIEALATILREEVPRRSATESEELARVQAQAEGADIL